MARTRPPSSSPASDGRRRPTPCPQAALGAERGPPGRPCDAELPTASAHVTAVSPPANISEQAASLTEPELHALMVAALEGDAVAYRRLLEALSMRLKAYFRSRLRSDPAYVDDLVQEALIAIHAKRATFDRAQPVGAWVHAIGRYKLIDHYRRLGRREFTPIDDELALAAPDEAPAAEARHDLQRGLAALPERARDLVVSVKLREEPVADVARRTGMSESAVKVAVHRGLRRLTTHLLGGKEAR